MARQDSPNRKERVRVFDREWDWQERHRYHEGSFVWGIILIFVGLIFFLNSFGIVPWSVWNYVWQFWPILLIIWGVQVVLGHNSFSRFVVGIFALIVIGFAVLFSITKVSPSYRQNLSPQINNMLNQMNNYQMRGFNK